MPATVPGGTAPTEPPQSWYRMARNEIRPASADVWIYAEIGYWGISAQTFVAELASLNVTDLQVHVNSPGGDVFDGIAIYNSLLNHPASVTVRVEGLAASAASFIAMAGDTVVMERSAQMMIHDASGLAMGDAASMREHADLLDRLSDTIADLYAQRAGGDVAAWRQAMLAETWYSSSEALAAGLVDEVAQADAKDEPSKGEDGPAAQDRLRAAWTGSAAALRGRYQDGKIVPSESPESPELPAPPLIEVVVDVSALSTALRGAFA
jgi:ATP-dependent protease ClpP protease subunit